MQSSSSKPAPSDGVCIWDAFGTYSCGNPGASVSGRAMFPAAVLEGFFSEAPAPAPGPAPAGQQQPRPPPKAPAPPSQEGFCGCSANLH